MKLTLEQAEILFWRTFVQLISYLRKPAFQEERTERIPCPTDYGKLWVKYCLISAASLMGGVVFGYLVNQLF